MMKLFLLLFSALFIENYVFVKHYGLCPLVGTGSSVRVNFGLGVSVMAVTTLSGAVLWPFYRFLFIPFDLEEFTTPLFLVIIAFFVQILEMVLQKRSPALFAGMGAYLPLTAVNCVIIAALRTAFSDFSGSFSHFFGCIGYCLGASLSFAFALMVFTGVRKRIQEEDLPPSFRGIPMVLISAGLVAVAFYAFSLLKL